MLAIGAALVSTEARAGCSHPWVRSSTTPPSLERLSIFELDPPGATAHPTSPDDRRSPCARGECSESPTQSDRTGITLAERVELWGDLPLSGRPLVPCFSSFRESAEEARPARIPIPIERPPRTLLGTR